MVSDEKLKTIRDWAERAVNDGQKGLTITLAMDPVVMFSMATELLRRRGEDNGLASPKRIKSVKSTGGLERMGTDGRGE